MNGDLGGCKKMSVIIIAEAGVNHNGSIDLAYKLIDVAVEAKADYVKFQTFIAEEGVSQVAPKAEYQRKLTGSSESQLEMVKKLELSYEQFKCLNAYCIKKGIFFLSTPFDFPSINFLEEINMPFWKIPSGEITNLPYLDRLARTHKDIVISTGMSTIEEVRLAMKILKENGAGKITILHCNTEYPTPMADVNLRAMETLRKEFNVDVGYSDHTVGIEVPIAATALGATVIEKHFTLDKSMHGPDHISSLEPEELKTMVRCIRNVEHAMGNGIKTPSPSEINNIAIARKSIVARKDINSGEILTEENLAIKRPGNGISPMKWYDILGTKAIKNFSKDEPIEI